MKKTDLNKCQDEQSACEIIELAIDDIETLARAFTLIKELCACTSSDEEAPPSGLSDEMLH